MTTNSSPPLKPNPISRALVGYVGNGRSAVVVIMPKLQAIAVSQIALWTGLLSEITSKIVSLERDGGQPIDIISNDVSFTTVTILINLEREKTRVGPSTGAKPAASVR